MLSSLPMSHISFEKRLVLFNRVAAYSLNILADEFAGHGSPRGLRTRYIEIRGTSSFSITIFTRCGCFPTMPAIIIRIARILDSGRKRFLVRDLEGCIVVTIELLNPHRCSVVQRTRFLHPYILRYMRSSCGRSPQERISRPVVPSASSLQAVVLANRTISGADRVLAKHRVISRVSLLRRTTPPKASPKAFGVTGRSAGWNTG